MSATVRLTADQLEQAALLLLNEGIVAFPTETVFGLGGLATSEQAIQRIFQAKGRPSDNPLIVHLGSVEQLSQCAVDVPDLAWKFFDRFAPGPLTLVLPKHPSLAPSVTAGLSTVGVRIPQHPIAHALLQRVAKPIAAPSANRSGSPSGTTWRSVLEDLDHRIDAILCEDGCQIGLESTVLDLCHANPRLLRAGAISMAELQEVVGSKVRIEHRTNDLSGPVASPGMKHRHYRPRATVVLFDSPNELSALLKSMEPTSQAYIGLEAPGGCVAWADCSLQPSVEAYAASLFEYLRQADRHGVEVIFCQRVSSDGIGMALMDRLQRACEPISKE